MIRRVVMLAPILLAPFALAQDYKAAEDSVRSAMLHKPRLFRDFDAASSINLQADGDRLKLYVPASSMLSEIQVQKTSLHGAILKLTATRFPLIFDKVGNLHPVKYGSSLVVQIDLTGASPTLLANLGQELTFPDPPSAVDAMPQRIAQQMRSDPGVVAKDDSGTPACTCAEYLAGSHCELGLGQDSGARAPVVTRSVEPDFSDEARRARVSGRVWISLVADADGKPKQVWIVQPIGAGLDEQAALAVLQYRFKPATCSHTPVPIHLDISVQFQMF